MGFLVNNRNTRIPKNASFRLTQGGREKLQEFKGDDKSNILVQLETNGSSSVSELASSTGISRGKIEKLIPKLIDGGHIQYISGGQGGSLQMEDLE